MKNLVFLFIAILTLFFYACDLDGSSDYTPEILVNKPLNQKGDSLKIFYTDTPGEFRSDTIQVGDTISMSVIFNAVGNNLTALYLKQSSTAACELILPSKNKMDSIFIAGTDYNSGKFLMKGDSPLLFLSFKYVAKQESNDAKISFTIVSDAKFDTGFGSNSAYLAIKTPIKKAKK